MLRLYTDEDSMDQALVRALRARDFDVVTADEVGMIERSDPDHLEYATRERWVLCTFNIGDFWTLHGEYLSAGKRHAGMILMPQQRYGTGEHLRRLLRLAATLSPELQLNPTGAGLSFHRLDRARDKRFWSVRASRDIRPIVHRTDASLLICYVGHHGDAYQWAERRKLKPHPRTGAA